MIVVDDGSTDAHRGDRRRVRRPPDPHREPRPRARPQHRARGRDGRDRRLHRRRRLPRPALARATSRHAFRDDRPRRRRRPEHRRPTTRGIVASASRTRPAGRSTCCSPTTDAEHIPGCNMAFRQRRAGGDRRLRPAVPRRRRRRRRLLAAAGAGLDARLQPRRGRLAPAPRLGARLPAGSSAATARPRRCSSASGRRSYNRGGHLAWAGRVYDRRAPPARAGAAASTTAPGAAACSSRVYEPHAEHARSLPLMPEWYLADRRARRPVARSGLFGHPLLLALPLLGAVGCSLLVGGARRRRREADCAPGTPHGSRRRRRRSRRDRGPVPAPAGRAARRPARTA